MSLVFCLSAAAATPDYPQWWLDRGVINTNTVVTNDFAAVNAGQLKWFATNAMAEMDLRLPGGAGSAAHALVSGFTPSNNYWVVNAGQLKCAAAPFYATLIQVGYTNAYPWTPTTNDDSDFSVVNVGQLKNIFSFDFTRDSDTDQIPDWWERKCKLNPSTNDAAADADSDGVPNLNEYQQGTLANQRDSDSDGMGEGMEAYYGYSPTASNAYTRLPFYEYFESNTVAQGDINGRNGWQVTAASPAVAQSATVLNGNQSLEIPPAPENGALVYHLFGAASNRVVWSDLSVKPVFRTATNPPSLAGSSAAAFFFNAAGRLVVHDGNQPAGKWLTLSNHTPISASTWIRLSVREDFDSRKWDLWLNGKIVAANLGFANQVSEFTQSRISGGNNASVYVDDFVINTNQPDYAYMISGQVTYNGPQAGLIRVVAVTSPLTGVFSPGPSATPAGSSYTINNAPAYSNYWVKAWCDSNTNGIRDSWEAWCVYPASPIWLNRNLAGINLALFDPDADYDGLADYWEINHGMDPYFPDSLSDSDHDGLPDNREIQLGLNPANPDSDGDGMGDAAELALGRSPSNTEAAASLPFTENFEPATVGSGDINGFHGWSAATSNMAVAQTSMVYEGTQSLHLSPVCSLPSVVCSQTSVVCSLQSVVCSLSSVVCSLPIAACSDRTVWLEFYAQPARRLSSLPPELSAATAAGFYVNSNGCVTVCSGPLGARAWTTLTNHPPITPATWHRFTIRRNSTTRKWDFWLNGTNLAHDLLFAGNLAEAAIFRTTSPSVANAFIDKFTISTNKPTDLILDDDWDGLPNSWELQYGFNPNDPSDSQSSQPIAQNPAPTAQRLFDPDLDGLSNLQEYLLGLNPTNPDSDGDGMGDGAELANGFSPSNSNVYTSLPLNEDFETPAVTNGPLNDQNRWLASPSNLALVQTGTVYSGSQALMISGPAPDTASTPAACRLFVGAVAHSNVWISAAIKPVLRIVTNPPTLSSNTIAGFFFNASGYPVVFDSSAASNNWITLTNQAPITPSSWSTICIKEDFSTRTWSFWLNGSLAAADLGFASTQAEFSLVQLTGSSCSTTFIDKITISTNAPTSIDEDNDGLPTWWELLYGLNPHDPSDSQGSQSTAQSLFDLDLDGLSNLAEYRAGTNPTRRDTDGDGIGDGAEIGHGTSPSVSNSFAGIPFVENFEPPAVTTGALDGQNGWAAFPMNVALVQTSTVYSGSQALLIPAVCSLSSAVCSLSSVVCCSHPVAASGATNVWIDFSAIPVRRLVQDDPAVSTSSLSAFFLDSTGHLKLCDGPASWRAIDTTINSTNWTRFTIFQDFSVNRWAIWVNNALVAQNLCFANPVNEFSMARLSGAREAATHIDNLAISTNEPANLDNDGDGLPNWWERLHGLEPATLNPSSQSPQSSTHSLTDSDFDGLSNLEEYQLGTNPTNPDSDGDGLVDGRGGFLPIGSLHNGTDRNGDGFIDGELDCNTNPLNADSDADGLSDGFEVANFLDPLSSVVCSLSSPLAWYKLNETNGTTIVDSGANHLDGTLIGSNIPNWTVGRTNSALVFNGANNGIVVPHNPILNLATSITISAWTMPTASDTATGAVQTIVAKNGAYSLVLNNHIPEFRFLGFTPATITAATTVARNRWTHLGASLSSSAIALYVDGTLVASTNIAGSAAATTNPLGLGYNATLSNNWFSGALCDVRLFNSTLSTTDVRTLYLTTADPYDSSSSNPTSPVCSLPSAVPLLPGDLDGDGRRTARDVSLISDLVTNLNRNVTRFYYDAEGHVTNTVDALGNSTRVSYNRNGQPLVTIDALGNTASNQYDSVGQVVAVWDPLGNVTRYAYNAFGNATNVTDALGNVSRMYYNDIGQVTNTINPRGIAQVSLYDDLKRVQCVITAAGTTNEMRAWSFYNAADNLVSNRNNLGVVSEYQYDPRGKLVRQIDAKGTADQAIIETGYDAAGRQVWSKDARGNTATITYDAIGRQVAAVDYMGNTATVAYDNLGNVVKNTQPSGRTVTFQYDKLGRRTRTLDGADSTSTEYDLLDRPVAQVNWRGIRSETYYDAVGNVTNQIAAKGEPAQTSTSTFYDAARRPVRVVNANTNSIRYAYDALGNRTNVTDELGISTRWLYQYGSVLVAYTRPDGTVVSNVLDNLNRITAVKVNGTLQQAFGYDSLSRMTNAWDYNRAGGGDDALVTFEYDNLNRVVREKQNGREMQRQYDANGNVQQITYPSGLVINRTFNKNNQLATLGSPAKNFATYTYTANSRVQTIAYGSGVTETHAFDSRERLNSLTQSGNSSFNYSLQHDPNGNISAANDHSGDNALYTYDALDRVTSATNTTALLNELFKYDKMGNWQNYSNALAGAVDRTINAGNQYTQIGPQSLAYDPNGSLTNWNNRAFAYDHLDRLVEVKSNGNVVAQYSYDALNRRTAKSVYGLVSGVWSLTSSVSYVYNGNDLIEEYVNGVLARKFVYGDTIDTPVVMQSGANEYYYLRDWRANISAVTDAAGNTVESYKYLLFGQVRMYGSMGQPLTESAIGNPWTYTGRQYDQETGLMHYRNRAYSPELGRFLQRDPAGYIDGLNLYAYTGNNPLIFTDPYGLYRWSHEFNPGMADALFNYYEQVREYQRRLAEYEAAVRAAQEEEARRQAEAAAAASERHGGGSGGPNEDEVVRRRNRLVAAYGNKATSIAQAVSAACTAKDATAYAQLAKKYSGNLQEDCESFFIYNDATRLVKDHGRGEGVTFADGIKLSRMGIPDLPKFGESSGINSQRQIDWLNYYVRNQRVVTPTMQKDMESNRYWLIDALWDREHPQSHPLLRRNDKQFMDYLENHQITPDEYFEACNLWASRKIALEKQEKANLINFGVTCVMMMVPFLPACGLVGDAIIAATLAGARTAASGGDWGDIAESAGLAFAGSALGSLAGSATFGATGYQALSVAVSSATSTFVSEGGRTLLHGGSFDDVMTNAGISFGTGFVAGGLGRGLAPEGTDKRFMQDLFWTTTSKAFSGAAHTLVYGGNIGRAVRQAAFSPEALIDTITSVAKSYTRAVAKASREAQPSAPVPDAKESIKELADANPSDESDEMEMNSDITSEESAASFSVGLVVDAGLVANEAKAPRDLFVNSNAGMNGYDYGMQVMSDVPTMEERLIWLSRDRMRNLRAADYKAPYHRPSEVNYDERRDSSINIKKGSDPYGLCGNNPDNFVDPFGLCGKNKRLLYLCGRRNGATPNTPGEYGLEYKARHWGHVWVMYSDENGTLKAWGMYPGGMKHSDSFGHAEYISVYELNSQASKNFMKFVGEYEKSSTKYAPVSENCSDFVYKALNAAGVNTKGSDWGINTANGLIDSEMEARTIELWR